MMELELHGTRHRIPPGEMSVGSAPSSGLHLSGEGILPEHAVLDGMPDGSVAIRKAVPEAEIQVNNVRLGENPSPLLHGDKVRIGDLEMLVVDSGRVGHTQFMSPADFPEPTHMAAGEGHAQATGGRLVCLTDGREYDVEARLVFGREAGADVVVSGPDVSRTHAEIIHEEGRYILRDHSTNGTFVNGVRVGPRRPLVRSDVIRIGTEEFRFYAEAADAAAPDAVAAQPPGAEQKLFDTMHGIPVAAFGPPSLSPAADGPDTSDEDEEYDGGEGDGDAIDAASPVDLGTHDAIAVYGSLLVRTGEQQGSRLTIRAPVVNLGRAQHNDIVIDDSSVSSSHAKLQLRDTIWVVADLDSTNGTFADDIEVTDEVALAPGSTIRLGEVSFLFDPAEVDVPFGDQGTRVMGAMELPEPDVAVPEVIGLEAGSQVYEPAAEPAADDEPLVVPLSEMQELFAPAVEGAPPPVAAEVPPPAEEEDPEPALAIEEPATVAEQTEEPELADAPTTSGQRPMFVSGGTSARGGPPLGLVGLLVLAVLAVVLYFLGLLDPVVDIISGLVRG